jgi:hypothetical protein
MMAGFSMAVVSTPIDVVKTRIMNRSAGGPAPYRGMFDCLVKVPVRSDRIVIATDRCPFVTNPQTAQAEGVLGLYKGFVPTFLRLGTLSPISPFRTGDIAHLTCGRVVIQDRTPYWRSRSTRSSGSGRAYGPYDVSSRGPEDERGECNAC